MHGVEVSMFMWPEKFPLERGDQMGMWKFRQVKYCSSAAHCFTRSDVTSVERGAYEPMWTSTPRDAH